MTSWGYLQMRCVEWCHKAFEGLPFDYWSRKERSYRFAEEAIELGQALDMTREDWEKILDYTYSRPKGDIKQEVGGVMVTLLSLCGREGISAWNEGDRECQRINQPEIMAKIRAKQADKKAAHI